MTQLRAPQASRWRYLGLVVPELDARIGWRRHRRTMSDPELAACRTMLARVPAAVSAWSEGNAVLELVGVVTAERPIRRLARVGGGWWLDPESAMPLLERALPRTTSIDSVIALYPSDGDRGLTGAWGYTWGHVGWLGGAGFSAIVSDPWHGWAGMVDAEHGFVHEWLHQVESAYRALGLTLDELPALHDVADRRTTRTDVADRVETYVEHERRTGSWRPWYRDLMTGTVGPKTGEGPAVRGLTPDRWARRVAYAQPMTDAPFVPPAFVAPGGLTTDRFVLVPLGPQHNERDYAAWSSSIDHIHATPGFPDGEWPHEMTLEENRGDLERHQRDFSARTGFTYTVLDPADGDVIGCLYIYPLGDAPGAEVRSWVRADQAALDVPLAEAVAGWLERDWPFDHIRYKGRPDLSR